MANAYRTTADVAHFNDTDMDLVVSEVLDEAPFLAGLAARSVKGTSFVYTRKTANPSSGFRNANEGRENTKSSTEKITNSLGIYDASVALDKAVALADERGADHAVGFEAVSALRGAFANLEKQILSGTIHGISGTTAFDGFADQANLDGISDAMVVDAGGSAVGACYSAWLVRTGEGDVQALWGQDGAITIGERQEVPWTDTDNQGTFTALYHSIMGWAGLKIGSSLSVARVANIDASNPLTDDLIAAALALFPASRRPNQIVMGRSAQEGLRASRTATHPTGDPAPLPEPAFKIPIVVTDSAIETETALV